jgi:hypothetical protein
MGPCPVHEQTEVFNKGGIPAVSGPSPIPVKVTIEHRMDKSADGKLLYQETNHTGIGFVCPWCRERSLLRFYKFCPYCASAVEFE